MALWYLFREGIRVSAFIHDEVIVELPNDDKLQDTVARIDQLMIAGMQQVIHNVKIKVEGALMHRWDKKAFTVHNPDGTLGIWLPGMVKPAKKK